VVSQLEIPCSTPPSLEWTLRTGVGRFVPFCSLFPRLPTTSWGSGQRYRMTSPKSHPPFLTVGFDLSHVPRYPGRFSQLRAVLHRTPPSFFSAGKRPSPCAFFPRVTSWTWVSRDFRTFSTPPPAPFGLLFARFPLVVERVELPLPAEPCRAQERLRAPSFLFFLCSRRTFCFPPPFSPRPCFLLAHQRGRGSSPDHTEDSYRVRSRALRRLFSPLPAVFPFPVHRCLVVDWAGRPFLTQPNRLRTAGSPTPSFLLTSIHPASLSPTPHRAFLYLIPLFLQYLLHQVHP